jgi:hypothetical protein
MMRKPAVLAAGIPLGPFVTSAQDPVKLPIFWSVARC